MVCSFCADWFRSILWSYVRCVIVCVVFLFWCVLCVVCWQDKPLVRGEITSRCRQPPTNSALKLTSLLRMRYGTLSWVVVVVCCRRLSPCFADCLQDAVYTEINPRNRASPRVLWLSFLAERHYNSLYPIEGQLPVVHVYCRWRGSRVWLLLQPLFFHCYLIVWDLAQRKKEDGSCHVS